MKKILATLAAVLLLSTGLGAQTYLVNTHTPVKSLEYKAYRYNGPSSPRIKMSGGLEWYGGFVLGHNVGPYEPGYVEFDLGGKYETLMFVVGHENYGMGAGGSGIDLEPKIVTIYADGVKVRDGLVYPYGVPKRILLNVKGVRKLEFRLIQGEGYIAFGEVTLWKAGQTPRETGNLITSAPKTIQLCKDLRPYFQNVNMRAVPDNRVAKFSINSRDYNCGLRADMDMAMIGENPGWAYFNLRGQYSKLSFIAGPLNGTTHGTGWLTVKADGKIIWEWEVKHDDTARQVTLDVSGCEMLSFHSEHVSGSLMGGFAEIMAIPEGDDYVGVSESEAPADPRLKTLPDVCRLMSNIKPFSAESSTKKQIYDGTSDYITFSMGGTKFSEGFILYETASFLDDNIISYTVFDLGHEFDYLSFTAGYVGKSWSMTNDLLRVYADDELVLETSLLATAPNREFTVPLHKCRKLRFENRGSGNLKVGAFGVADLVLYRGKPVANNLFVHPKPECPYETDLLDLGKPYIHYVSTKEDSKDEICYDGSTMKKYWQVGDRRVNKGFLLQTSSYFSLDHGPLSDGTDNAAAGALGGAAVGSAFVAGGAAVGGAMVGSTLVGAAALLVLAAGGTAVDNSCAAFNTYGEYNSVTFTVACYKPYLTGTLSNYTETLWIGVDGVVTAEMTVYESMEPQTITVPISGCRQLMFWLANTNGTSGQYVFYDVKLTKAVLPLDIPKKARMSKAVVSKPLWTSPEQLQTKWERPRSSGESHVDDYLMDVSNIENGVNRMLDNARPEYEIRTYFLETNAGQVCKAVRFKTGSSDVFGEFNIISAGRTADNYLQEMLKMRSRIIEANLKKVNANLRLPALGFRAVEYGKIIKQAGSVLAECKELIDIMIAEKTAEIQFIDRLVNSAVDIDGKMSTEKTIFCPLFPEDEIPDGGLMLVETFN